MKLLEAEGISKRFGGLTALDGVSISANDSEITGLIGPNGAGKTTLFNCLLGSEKPDRGRVVFDGHDIGGLPIHRRARFGLARTFQRMELFAEMTAREHLLAAIRSREGGSLAMDVLGQGRPKSDELGEAQEILDLLAIADIGDRPVESLSLGHSRLVELGRALATRPKLLMLDEPSSGLDRTETAELADVLIRVAGARGMGILMVEHDLELVRGITNRLYVLDVGKLIASGPTAEVLEDEGVRQAYLGGRPETESKSLPARPARTGTDAGPVLRVEDIRAAYGPFRALFGVSLTVDRGAAVALLGANGAGKSTLARVVAGVIPASAGKVVFDGVDVTRLRPHRRARLGLIHVPEGRSVFATLTTEENLILHLESNGHRKHYGAALDRAYEAFPQLAARRHQRAKTLSGGEQRMLALAAIVVQPPRLLIVDELSLGLAPQMVDDVYRALAAIREAGTSLLIVEQHVARAFSLADSYVLLSKGEVVAGGPAGDIEVVRSYLPDEPAG